MNLNGPWEFRFDDQNIGLEQRWFTVPPVTRSKILVPFSFESPQSGIGDRSFHPCVWYRRRSTFRRIGLADAFGSILARWIIEPPSG